MTCVKAQPGLPGVCAIVPTLGSGLCYSDLDCPESAFCQGAVICPCGGECTWLVGQCKSCCSADVDCGPEKACVAGNCELAAPSLRCWNLDDCPLPPNCRDPSEECPSGYACTDLQVCPCGTYCGYSSEPGWCVLQLPECCAVDQDCSGQSVCVMGHCVQEPTDGACWTAADCVGDKACVDAAISPCGEPPVLDMHMGQCGGTVACCWADAECPNGFVCAGADALSGVKGECKQKTVAAYTCWSDGECALGEQCVGSSACGCGQSCEQESPGNCKPIGGPMCCHEDDDCLPGQACVGVVPNPDGEPGRCVPSAVQGTCWHDWDCSQGWQCSGATVCSCLTECAPVPGMCEEGAPCCTTDPSCDEVGARCVNGVCKEPLPGGACWDDKDCGAGVCVGAFVCPCDSSCGQPDVTGTCNLVSDNCCGTWEQCADAGLEGYVCLYSTDGLSELGRCYYPAEYPQCWQDDDCGPIENCWNVAVCGCKEADCEPHKGLCLLFGLCCDKDQDCSNGMECVPSSWMGPEDGVCKQTPPLGHCWHDGDCSGGGTCEEAFVCPCDAMCDDADVQGKCSSG
jgi:hypothetical protein